MELAERFEQLYSTLEPGSMALLPAVYHESVTFIDPITSHQGLSALDAYFRRLLSGSDMCQFTISRLQFGDTDGWVTWTMNFRHPRLDSGQWIAVEGVSIVTISENRIVFQRDYYDMGEMLYERVPVLGRIIRALRERLM